MTNNFSRKSLIEWTIKAPTSFQCRVFSKTFSVQNHNCILEFYSGYDIRNNACLFLKSNGEMDPPVTIAVRVALNHNSFGDKTESVATDKFQIIWLHPSRLLQGLLLTFEVAIDNDPSKGKLMTNTLFTYV